MTGVDTPLVQTSTYHGVVDLSWVGLVTASSAHSRDLDLLKEIRSGSTGSQTAPACDPTLGTVTRSGHRVGKTSKIYVPEEEKEPRQMR